MRPRTFFPPLGIEAEGNQPPVPSASGEINPAPPSLLGMRDGGNAAQAGWEPATTGVAGCPAMERLGLIALLKSPSTRPREIASIGMDPMREPKGSNKLAEGDDSRMANSRAISPPPSP